METATAPTHPAEVLRRVEAQIAELRKTDLTQLPPAELAQLQERAEIARRCFASVQNDVLDVIDRTATHHRDGHTSAKVMIRHQGRLSNAEALARQRVMNAMRALPLVAAAFRNGTVGVDQVRTLAGVWANERVRDALAMPHRQATFLKLARTLSHKAFVAEVAQWERLIDEDGPSPENERNHRHRNVSLHQDPFGLGWTLNGSFGSTNGAELHSILSHYFKAEFEADWEAAKAVHGQSTMHSHLARTEAQRRADALLQMARDAAGSHQTVPPGFVHNIVWSHDAFEEMVRRSNGADAKPLNPDTFRCHTIDGVRLDPTEAFANAVLNHIRRAIVDTAGVVIDLGEARLFTRGSRAAVQLNAPCCVWPGCQVPTSECQADHLTEHSRGGRTCPSNGAPLCGRHNRWKQKGYVIVRDPDGTWHTYRPDGTKIR